MKKSPVLVVLLISFLISACTSISNPLAPNTAKDSPWMQDKAKAWDSIGVETLNKMKKLSEEGKSEEVMELQKTIDVKSAHNYLKSSAEKLAQTDITNSKQMKKEIYNLLDLYAVIISFEFSELNDASEQERLQWCKDNVEMSKTIAQAAEKHLGNEEPTLIALRNSIKSMEDSIKTIESRMEEKKSQGENAKAEDQTVENKTSEKVE